MNKCLAYVRGKTFVIEESLFALPDRREAVVGEDRAEVRALLKSSKSTRRLSAMVLLPYKLLPAVA